MTYLSRVIALVSWANVRIKQSGLWEPSLLAEQPRLSAHLGPGVYWAGDGCGRDAGT